MEIKVRELKEDLLYLESNEKHVISMIHMFQMFLEDRYRNEKRLAGGKIEIYEELLKEQWSCFYRSESIF